MLARYKVHKPVITYGAQCGTICGRIIYKDFAKVESLKCNNHNSKSLLRTTDDIIEKYSTGVVVNSTESKRVLVQILFMICLGSIAKACSLDSCF